jgi:hypothetical protein
MTTLPPPDLKQEDAWLHQWMMSEETFLLEMAECALAENRTQFAGRIASLLEDDTLAKHPALLRAQQATRLQLHPGGLGNGEDPDDCHTLRRRRQQRIKRNKDRRRRSVNAKDPRFRRK